VRQLLILALFLTFSTLCYFLQSLIFWAVLIPVFALATAFSRTLRGNLTKFALLFKLLSVTLALTFIMNFLILDLDTALIYTIRLLVMSYFSLQFAFIFGIRNLKIALQALCTPLKRWVPDIHTILDLSFAMIPTVTSHLVTIKQSLQVKGFNFAPRNVIAHPLLLLDTFAAWYERTEQDLTKTLFIKGVR
jgi:hypothetical protein